MKKPLILGLLFVGVVAGLAALFEKEVGAVTCVSPYSHKSYLVYGVEKHSCVKSTTGSGIFDWGFWGISKKSLKGGLGLQVQYFGTIDSSGEPCDPNFDENGQPGNTACLIPGRLFCCNGGGQCGGQGQPFTSETLSVQAVLEPAECNSTGKCSDQITLDLDDSTISLVCQNRNWGGTFTPQEMYVQSCTCDTGFATANACNGAATPSCNVELCSVSLTGYQPGTERLYSCVALGDSH